MLERPVSFRFTKTKKYFGVREVITEEWLKIPKTIIRRTSNPTKISCKKLEKSKLKECPPRQEKVFFTEYRIT